MGTAICLLTITQLTPSVIYACSYDLTSTSSERNISLHIEGTVLCAEDISITPLSQRVFAGYYELEGEPSRVNVSGNIAEADNPDEYNYSISSSSMNFQLQPEWDCRDAPGFAGHYTKDSIAVDIALETRRKLTSAISPSGVAYEIIFESSEDEYQKQIKVAGHKIETDMPCDGALHMYDIKEIAIGEVRVYEVTYDVTTTASGPITGPTTVYLHQNGEMLTATTSGDKRGYEGEWYNYTKSECGIALNEEIATHTCLDGKYETIDNQFRQLEEKEIKKYRIVPSGFTPLESARFKRGEILNPGGIPAIEHKAWSQINPTSP